ncbi:MAG: fatty acid desaturase [Planctomycetia bacterium]|nr:fatty acid desaturase [Planctomycetia bacterium]
MIEETSFPTGYGPANPIDRPFVIAAKTSMPSDPPASHDASASDSSAGDAAAAKVEHEANSLFMRQVRSLVKDLLEPNPWIYWTDMLLTLVVGQGAFFLFSLDTLSWAVRAPAFVVAAFAFYRATVFTHELSHFRKGTFRGFRATWNALVGVPFLLPAFLYEDHRLHHVNHSYGTEDDSEYLPLASGTAWDIVRYFLKALLVPVLGIFRFVILAPLGWFSASWRQWMWQRSSSALAINWNYRRSPEDESAHPVEMRVMEICCFVYGIGFFTLMVFGILPISVFFNFYAVFLCVALINYVRTLGAHRYRGVGEPMTYIDQILDSYTIAGQETITSLMAPLGMRFHALHHLVPSLPYHNMRTAHYRLVAGLPADSPYHRTIRRTLWQAVGEVVRRVREADPIEESALVVESAST